MTELTKEEKAQIKTDAEKQYPYMPVKEGDKGDEYKYSINKGKVDMRRMAFINGATRYALLLKEEKERAKGLVDELRKLFSDYVKTEGCGCCQTSSHTDHGNAIGELLGFEKYEDGSGYNLYKLPSPLTAPATDTGGK